MTPADGHGVPVVIRTRGVIRQFGAVTAVDGLDLEVRRGQILALLGPSGCGKTTMLRLLAGFERPDHGSVEIDGRTVAAPGVWVPPQDRRVGMVFQDYALFPHLTVEANVGFGLPATPRRPGRRAAQGRTAEVLDLVGLGGLGGRYPHQLSGGQQQRVALARALAPRPSVVLLDEPFSNLDAGLRVQLRTEVARILRAADATAVFVTHGQEEAFAIADEVAVLRGGRIAQQATPEVLYHAPVSRSVATFVGDAEFLPGDHQGDRVRTELGLLTLVTGTEAGPGPVDVMVRPEDLRLTADPEGDALIVHREFYGHDQMLFCRLPTGRVIRARLGALTDLRLGDHCQVDLDIPVQAFNRSQDAGN